MNKKINAPLGASLIVLSSFFYASYGIWTKLMGDFFGGYTASAYRSVLVLFILIPISYFLNKFEPLRLRKNAMYLLGMIFFSFFIWGPLYYAILNAGVGLALTVAYANIVIGMFFFGWLMAGERLTKDKILSAVLGLIGLGLIFIPTGNSGIAMLALIAAAVSGLSTAANTVITKKIPYNAAQTTIALWATSVIANFIMVIVISENIPAISFRAEYFYLLLFAIASVISTWSLVKGVKIIEAGAAGVLGLLEIVFGIMFGVLLFNEEPGLLALIGAVVIIIAAAIPYIKDYNSKKGTLESS